MENLKLLEQPEEQPKKKTWLQERIDDFLVGFKQTTGKTYPIPYPQLVGMLSAKANNAMGGWATVSEDEKEIVPGYPEMDVWIEQRKGFFQDEFAGMKTGFSFSYFLKQFGTFVKYIPNKEKPINKTKPIIFYCTKCKKNVDESHQCD